MLGVCSECGIEIEWQVFWAGAESYCSMCFGKYLKPRYWSSTLRLSDDERQELERQQLPVYRRSLLNTLVAYKGKLDREHQATQVWQALCEQVLFDRRNT